MKQKIQRLLFRDYDVGMLSIKVALFSVFDLLLFRLILPITIGTLYYGTFINKIFACYNTTFTGTNTPINLIMFFIIIVFNFTLIFFNTIDDCGFVITFINSIVYFFFRLNIFLNKR